MANYSNITLTKDGQAVLTQAIASGTAQFTKVKTGSGVYAAGEVLSDKTDLKSIRQIIPITGVIKKDRTTLLIRCVITNDGITEEYPINELGLYAMNTETNKEVLFALVVASNPDYIIPFEQTPISITLELYMSITDADNVTFSFELMEGIYATAEDLATHESDTVKHVTSAERTAWNAKLDASEYNTRIVGGSEVLDFNTLLTTKNYAFSSNAISIALNAPVKSSGILRVIQGGGYTHHEYITNNGVVYKRGYNGSTWSAWKALAVASEVLPLTGGNLTGDINVENGANAVMFKSSRTQSDGVRRVAAYWAGEDPSANVALYEGSVVAAQFILKADEMIYKNKDNSSSFKVMHTGITSPVVVSETAPTDTTALWVW